ncbi:hypothetical protein SAMN04487972_101299 [Paracoccus halophilus]|uniref:Lipoprotein n=1 Tax=Paracoccus halophilus TaxID=376733 RepID=A0A099F2R5_9RHOB|nr:hypothetical protein [Paracoccus halophilus]KGJ04970.1 hypothetical protein IT41_08055 [Paracoccus halophilus]SFA39450.1 hypothetical protein SAMN04487972_101299 [Paracoccus halophilus]
MTRNILLAMTSALIVASCGTPQERCIRRNTEEYRIVSRLLTEVEANLARGYAWEERIVTSIEWDSCPVIIRDRDGDRRIVYRSCPRHVADTQRYRVAIDPQAERRKRDGLAARKKALTPGATEAVRACKAAYPEAKEPG